MYVGCPSARFSRARPSRAEPPTHFVCTFPSPASVSRVAPSPSFCLLAFHVFSAAFPDGFSKGFILARRTGPHGRRGRCEVGGMEEKCSRLTPPLTPVNASSCPDTRVGIRGGSGAHWGALRWSRLPRLLNICTVDAFVKTGNPNRCMDRVRSTL